MDHWVELTGIGRGDGCIEPRAMPSSEPPYGEAAATAAGAGAGVRVRCAVPLARMACPGGA